MRVAHLHFLRALDVRGDVAGLAHFEFLADVRLGIEAADFLDLDVLPECSNFTCMPGLQFAVEHAHVRDDAFVGVEIRIEPQRLQATARRSVSAAECAATIASRISSMPMPSLALARIAVSAGDGQNVFQLLLAPAERWRAARSILLMTGMIVRFCFIARWTLATVCASTPCAASMISNAPSHALKLRETS